MVTKEYMDKKFVNIDIKLDKIDVKFGRIDNQFSLIDARFDKIDNQFAVIDSKFTYLDNKIETEIANLARIILNAFEEQRRYFDGKYATSERVEKIEKDVRQVKTALLIP